MKKILFCLVFIIFLNLIFVSAFEFDNVKDFDKDAGSSGRGVATIKNAFGLGKTLAEIELIVNTDSCYINCYAEGKTILYEEGKLINSLRFERIRGRIESYEIFIKDNGKWIKYNNGDLSAGTYEWRIEGKKGFYDKVDWLGTWFGVEVDDWALWDSEVLTYYTFNESAGTTVNDVVDGRYDGTIVSGEDADRVTGIIGNGLRLNDDADGEYVNLSIQYNNDLTVDSNFTISYWLNISSTELDQTNYIYYFANNTLLYNRIFSSEVDGMVVIYAGGGHETGYNVTTGWQMFTTTYNDTDGNLSFYVNGTNLFNVITTPSELGGLSSKIGASYIGNNDGVNGTIDEFSIFNKTLNSSDVLELWNSGAGITYREEGGEAINILTITLNFPTDDEAFSTGNITFNGTIEVSNYNITNATWYIWNSTGEFNVTGVTITGGVSNETTLNINNFSMGSYEYNLFGCGVESADDTAHNCSFGLANYSFTIGSTIDEEFWENETSETAEEIFQINISLLEGSTIHSVKLNYNGTNYTVSDITDLGGNSYSFTKAIDIPLNPGLFINDSKNFYWNFVFADESDAQTYQITTERWQNISFIVLHICNATYDQPTVNFTLIDEVTGVEINGTRNLTDMEANFNYWIGTGTTSKNYSYQNLTANMSQFEFCIYPIWQMLRADMDMEYSAEGYSENGYYLRNSSLTNQTANIDLFSLPTSDSTKFNIVVQGGVDFLEGVVVTISKYFTGEGVFKTIGIKTTDSEGEFVGYLEIDKTYKFSIVEDGVFRGIIEKKASCPVAPCEITLQVEEDYGDIFTEYYDKFAINIVSNLSYNSTSKIVTYQFLDITGLSQYFRLVVSKSSFNTTIRDAICDESLYSSSGSLTCNVTGYTGDFFAYGYVSRSPEQIDKIISFIISTIREGWGILAVFFCLGIIITLVFTAAVISRGNPAVVVFVFGASILGLKLMTIFPFSWIVVALIELLVIFVMWEVKT